MRLIILVILTLNEKGPQYVNMSIVLLNYNFIWNKYQFMVISELSFTFTF